jgi:hypothetical protein
VGKGCVFKTIFASKSSRLQTLFIENLNEPSQTKLFLLTTIASTPPISLNFSPNHPHLKRIVAFCLNLHSLALMQMKCYDIWSSSSPAASLLDRFVDEFTVEQSSLLLTSKDRGWVHVIVAIRWRDGNGSPENKWLCRKSTALKLVIRPSNESNETWELVAGKHRANRCEEATFLQIEKVTKLKTEKGMLCWLQTLNLIPTRKHSLEWSVEKVLVKRDGRWRSERRSSNQSPWGLRFSYILTGLLNPRLRSIIMENPKDTLNP